MTANVIPDHYTDDALRAQGETGVRIGARGLVREADYMLRIRPELRLAAAGDARELCHRVPGHTYCDALSVVTRRPEYKNEGD